MKTNHSLQTTDSIRLSIIIPTFNCRAYLDECLQSILPQLPSDCELIVADDGSDDGTAELLAGYEGMQDHVHILYREHKGASAARNAGLDAAAGEYVTFMDCDDCMRDGFLPDSLPLLDKGTDLYIFGIERVPLSGVRELWSVLDRVYPDVSAFADEYVRIRQLMVYSSCNKFYRRSVLEEKHLRFDEGMAFGEDRMFNFRYLSCCRGRILTSSLIMFHYIQRSAGSMSSKHIPGYFACVSRLHEAKMDCILSLSTGTTEEEKLDFIAYDVSREVERTLARFEQHPEEKAENLPAVNRLVFGEYDDRDEPLDIIVVLGSRLCEYKRVGDRSAASGCPVYRKRRQPQCLRRHDGSGIHGVLAQGARRQPIGHQPRKQSDVHGTESGILCADHPHAESGDRKGAFRNRHPDRRISYPKSKAAGSENSSSCRGGSALASGLWAAYASGELV